MGRCWAVASLLAAVSGLPAAGEDHRDPIDFTELDALRTGEDIVLIAHRGGVVEEGSPECSLEAIRRAAKQGYRVVELDVRCSKDCVPILFHDGSLASDCGDPRSVGDIQAHEIKEISFKPKFLKPKAW